MTLAVQGEAERQEKRCCPNPRCFPAALPELRLLFAGQEIAQSSAPHLPRARCYACQGQHLGLEGVGF